MLLRTIPLLLLAFIAAAVVANQDAPKEAALPDDKAKAASGELFPAPHRGVAVTFKSGDAVDKRTDRLVALFVPAGQPATPLLPAGAFTAAYTGNIAVGLRGRYTFSLEGRGKVKMTLGDKVLLEGEGDLAAITPAEKVRLNKGENAFTLEYESPKDGDALLRLYWQSDEFPREPVHPTALTSGGGKLNDFGGTLPARVGRELFATLRCVKCHAPGDELAKAKDRMPELDLDAPSLAEAGSRLNEGWMAAWISNPRSLRADASMPRVHNMPGPGRGPGGNMVPMWAADVAAYLATVGKPLPAPPAAKPETIKAGGTLFGSLGCIGCHTLPDHKDDKTIDSRVPLKFASAKWQPAALRAFLRKPSSHYTWIRMPDFALSEPEADQLAAFLFSFPVAEVAGRGGRGRAPSVEHGKQMFQMHGCVACHDKGAKEAGWENHLKAPSLDALRKADWKKGCMAENASALGNAPDFSLSPSQRIALQAFAASELGWKSLRHDTAADFASRQIRQLQCTACHKRDGDNDRWSNHESEVASLLPKPAAEEHKEEDYEDDPSKPKKPQIDQSRPDLTWVGDKLKPQWMEQFFAGKLDYKLRPWLTARMPAFPARAHLLAQGLAMQHGHAPVAPDEPKPDAEAAKLGRQLVGPVVDGKAGFACTQCHGIGDRPASNVFEAQGINFIYVKERLRHDYYMRWMLLPTRVQPGTRMPKFAADDGTTPFVDVYGGDARKQFDAMWQYLQLGGEMKGP